MPSLLVFDLYYLTTFLFFIGCFVNPDLTLCRRITDINGPNQSFPVVSNMTGLVRLYVTALIIKYIEGAI